MLISINSIEVTEKEVILRGESIEDLIMADDLYEDAEATEVAFSFDRTVKSGGPMKYLFKIVSNQPRCKKEKSFGAMLDKLVGVITNISPSFLIKA